MFLQRNYTVSCLLIVATKVGLLHASTEGDSMINHQKSVIIADEAVSAIAPYPITTGATNPAEAHRAEHGVHIGGIYKHRNGHFYKVLNVACSAEDLSWSVIYEALYKNDVSQIWSRKLEDFLAVITLENGVQQPRFIYQEQV